MQCSLYGKLPAKRDFISMGAPRDFLNAWEPWLQGGVAASRNKLGRTWQAAFLTAPIWRFWLGADICGTSVIGAFMSSLDGIGRYFPLTLFACADANAAIPPPEFGSQDDWFDTVEAFLMSTLDVGANFEAISANFDALLPPFQELSKAAAQQLNDDTPATATDGRNFCDLFSSIRVRDHAKIYGGSSFWWTIGGDGFAPIAICRKRLPDPYLFSAMLTGDFVEALV
jgi:type VI secretion system protein ImpM